jgi:hypothetical protein
MGSALRIVVGVVEELIDFMMVFGLVQAGVQERAE